MQFGGTVLYVDEVPTVADFYTRAFGLKVRFYDESLGYAELETGASVLALASHSLGEMLMPDGYSRPTVGPTGVEIAFLTDDVPGSFAKAIARVRTRSRRPSECRGDSKWRTSAHRRAQSLAFRNHRLPRSIENRDRRNRRGFRA
jgi:lactoylglutathione lyase